jgi:hypothetical protein
MYKVAFVNSTASFASVSAAASPKMRLTTATSSKPRKWSVKRHLRSFTVLHISTLSSKFSTAGHPLFFVLHEIIQWQSTMSKKHALRFTALNAAFAVHEPFLTSYPENCKRFAEKKD